MKLNTTNSTTKKAIGKWLTIGNYELNIKAIESKLSANEQSTQVIFRVETPKVEEEGFVPVEGATGIVGTIRTIYLKHDAQVKEFVDNMALLADKLGVRAEVDAISADTITEYVKALEPIVKDKFFFGRVTGEQYIREADGKTGTTLHFSRFSPFASISEGIVTLKPVNASNPNDLKPAKPVEKVPVQGGEVF